MTRFKQRTVLAFAIVSFFVPTGGLIAVALATNQPEWQVHALWCTTDDGSSGRLYRRTCHTQDQFDSVIACQRHSRNDRAVQLIIAAGRPTVNAFMADQKPRKCR
jgi:hypothetical protein